MTPQAPLPTTASDTNYWNPNFQAYGNTYLIWGTDGVLQKYLVMSLSNKDRIIETGIEQGAGFTAIEILLKDGNDIDIEVVDTTEFAPPTLSQNPFLIVTPNATYTALMVGQSSNLARKREGMRNWSFKSFTAINLGSGNTL